MRTGRSTTLTLPSCGTISANVADSDRPELDNRMTGRSDHTAWTRMHSSKR